MMHDDGCHWMVVRHQTIGQMSASTERTTGKFWLMAPQAPLLDEDMTVYAVGGVCGVTFPTTFSSSTRAVQLPKSSLALNGTEFFVHTWRAPSAEPTSSPNRYCNRVCYCVVPRHTSNQRYNHRTKVISIRALHKPGGRKVSVCGAVSQVARSIFGTSTLDCRLSLL